MTEDEGTPLASHILAEELPVIKIRPGHIAEDLEDQLPKLSADERWQIRMEASKGRRDLKDEPAPGKEPISESELVAHVQEIAQETYEREIREGTFPGEIETAARPTLLQRIHSMADSDALARATEYWKAIARADTSTHTAAAVAAARQLETERMARKREERRLGLGL